MGVSPEVLNYIFRFAKGALGIHHPFFGKQVVQQHFIGDTTRTQLGNVPGAKNLAECLYGEKVFAIGRQGLPMATHRYPTTWHNTVQVRMEADHVRNFIILTMDCFYVYLLQSSVDQSWYIGFTKDLEKRIAEHNDGKSYYTKRKTPWKVIYYEVAFNKADAIAREKYLKTGMGRRYLKNRLKNQLNF